MEGQTTKETWGYGSLLLVILAFCYGPAVAHLVIGWWNVAAYSHGFLILPISLFLAWENRTVLQSLPTHPNHLGGGTILFLSAIILLIGRASAVMMLEQIALIILFPGLVLFFLGYQWLKAVAFPLCYLIFMLPFFDLLGEGIYWPLQNFTAHLATELLQLFGYAVYLQGQYIYLPAATLDVAKECAGLRYLISILAIGMPLAYMTLRSWSRRIGLVCTAILISILANGLRVMLVGVLVYAGEMEMTHGPFHIFQGMVISWIGFIVLFVGAWWLSKGEQALVK